MLTMTGLTKSYRTDSVETTHSAPTDDISLRQTLRTRTGNTRACIRHLDRRFARWGEYVRVRFRAVMTTPPLGDNSALQNLPERMAARQREGRAIAKSRSILWCRIEGV